MSVPASKRGVSEFEFYNTAVRLRVHVTMWLFISDKKTRITPLSQGFRFLKVRYDILPSGRILRRLDRDSFVRERRRLHTYRRLLDEGRITRLDVSNFYQSYKGQTRHFATHRSVRNLDSLYTELFVNN